MSKWTVEELEALLLSQGSYSRFFSLVPGTDKTYDAWEVKRRRYSAPRPRVRTWSLGPVTVTVKR